MNGHTKLVTDPASTIKTRCASGTLIDQIGSFLGASLGVILIGMLFLAITRIGV